MFWKSYEKLIDFCDNIMLSKMWSAHLASFQILRDTMGVVWKGGGCQRSKGVGQTHPQSWSACVPRYISPVLSVKHRAWHQNAGGPWRAHPAFLPTSCILVVLSGGRIFLRLTRLYRQYYSFDMSGVRTQKIIIILRARVLIFASFPTHCVPQVVMELSTCRSLNWGSHWGKQAD